MDKVSKQLAYRPTWAEIDLSAIEYNFKHVKNMVKDKVKVLVPVKADAYGHGAVEVAKRLIECGVDYFGVATVLEAIELRENKIKTPILLLSTFLPHEYQSIVKYKITPTIVDLDSADKLNQYLVKIGKKIAIHIKIDTGMGRLGVWHDDSREFIKRILRLKSLIIEGIYTHFPSADDDEKFTNLQIRAFDNLIEELDRDGIKIPLRHAANSEALMRYRHSHLNMVRPGLMIYGLYATLHSQRYLSLKPALSLKTKIAYLKDAPSGRSVSYGRTFIAERHSKIATLPIGYADGYNRMLSNRGYALVKGKRCPVVGRICMDHTMIDVTGIGAQIGDEVVLIGKQNNVDVSAERIAHQCLTISYEVVCWISKRVPRIYTD